MSDRPAARKHQLKLDTSPRAPIARLAGTLPTAPVAVVRTAPGPVTWLDRTKAYYKAVITIIGSLLVLINEATPLLNALPDNGKQYVTVGVVFMTSLSVFLKSNEHWVDGL